MLFCCSAIKSRVEFAEFIVLWTWASCAWIGSKQPPLKCSTKLWKRKRQNNFAIIIPFHWFKANGPHRISTLNFRNVVNENQYFFGISFAFNFLGLTLNVYFHFTFPENAGPTQKEKWKSQLISYGQKSADLYEISRSTFFIVIDINRM